MSVHPFLAAITISLAAAATLAPTPPARAQSVGGISGQGLTLQQVQRRFPGLREVSFEKADLNGDGLIEPSELPVLQGVYDQLNQSR